MNKQIKGRNKPDRPSMKDVAALAGVSRTTVSFVLNEVAHANIPLETRERVLAAVDQLGYRPNALAKELRTNRSHVIGFIADEIATTPFSGSIIKGAQEAAWRHGKILLIVNTERLPDVEKSAIDMMLERRVEGIIYAAVSHRAITPPSTMHEVSTVLVNCYAENNNLPSVVPDEVSGGYTATEFLLKKGHRRIAIINGEEQSPATLGRLKGYEQALSSFNVPIDRNLICFGDWWQEDGYRNALELMRSPDVPTAIFCGNDRIAIGAYDALKERGLSIPKDVAVVGFDNQDVISAHSRPRLTTVALPNYEMGQWAVEYLITHGDYSIPTGFVNNISTSGSAERQVRFTNHVGSLYEQPLHPPHATLRCPLIERDSA